MPTGRRAASSRTPSTTTPRSARSANASSVATCRGCSPSAIGARTGISSASHRSPAPLPLRIAVTGATGLIGRELVPFLTTAGHQVERLVRRPAAGPGEIAWDPARGYVDAEPLEGVDAVVHLAGESIRPPWTRSRRRQIRGSRVDGTLLLSGTLARLRRPPRVLVSMSGVNVLWRAGRRRGRRGLGPGRRLLGDDVRGLGRGHRTSGRCRDPGRQPAQRDRSHAAGRRLGDDAPAVPARRSVPRSASGAAVS